MKLFVSDTTLRDGEQSAGVALQIEEKVRIAAMLDESGVAEIEAGIPAMGGDEAEAVQAVATSGLRARVIAWSRPRRSDIEASLRCGVDGVAISVPVSDLHLSRVLRRDRAWALETMAEAVEFARGHGLYVCACAADASRADPSFVAEYANCAGESGADRVRFCDTTGILDPFGMFDAVSWLINAASIPIEVHAHNDFGMATANAVAGVQAGAAYVSTTVNGIGERAGNACLAEVVMALKKLKGIDSGVDANRLRSLSEYVALHTRRTLPVDKPIVGENIFVHESGIHADGVLKDPETYEPFPPEDVGSRMQVVLGKHSGLHAVRYRFSRELGIELSESLAALILSRVRRIAVREKRPPTDQELLLVYNMLRQEERTPSVSSC